MDGFYAAYLTGRVGNGFVLFAIRGQTFIGVDGGGLKYDGQVEITEQAVKCTVVYVIPAGATNLITGASPPEVDQRYSSEEGRLAGFSNP